MSQGFIKNNIVRRVIDQITSNRILFEDKLSDLQKQYDDDYFDTIDYIYNQDPSKSKKYFKWIFETWLKNSPKIDYEDLITMVSYFDKNPHKFEKKDLYQYDYDEFLKKYNEAILKLSKREIVSSGVEKLYEDDRYVLVRPKTSEASCKYGANTKWCISSRTNNYFNNYSSENLFFFIIDKIQEPIPGKKKSPNYFKVAIQYEPDQPSFDVDDISPEYKNYYVSKALAGEFTFWNSIDEQIELKTVKKYIPQDLLKKFLELIKNYTYKVYTNYYEKQLSSFQSFNFEEYNYLESEVDVLYGTVKRKTQKYSQNKHVKFVNDVQNAYYDFVVILNNWNLPVRSLEEFLEFKGIKEKFMEDLVIEKKLKNDLNHSQQLYETKEKQLQDMETKLEFIKKEINFKNI